MLKTRVVGVVLVRGGIAVQSVGFRRYLPIGRPEIAIEYLDRWGIDEIVLLHIDAWRTGRAPTAAEVTSYARQCRVPLTVGGGLAGVEDVRRVIQAGADKVAINSAAAERPAVIEDAAEQFGQQCVVVSVDARLDGAGVPMAWTHGGTRPTGRTAADAARRAEAHGAGEILVTSVDRDGSKLGYELPLLRDVVAAVHVPVIACGGAGHPEHLRDAMHTGVAAVAAGNFLHYTEHSVTLIKRHLADAREPVRLDSYADYAGRRLDAQGRLAKQDDEALDALRFRYIPEEVI